MSKEPAVPLFVVEEHHEAFFVWNYGIVHKMINHSGNTLLHVDSHEDMIVSCFNQSIDELEEDLGAVYKYCYEELAIASFIAPAIYRGAINNYTYLCRYDGFTGKRTNNYIASHKSGGKIFKTGQVSSLLRLQLESDDNQWGKYHFYSCQEIGLASSFSTSQSCILDIDLDFFSCDDAMLSAKTRIEITEEAYREFKNNKYHPFRLLPVSALSAEKEADRFFLCYNEWYKVPVVKAPVDVIDKRIDKFLNFISKNRVRPGLIDICRSRFSGYTPVDQWKYIEDKLIEGLSRLFKLEMFYINDFEQVYGGNNEITG